MSSSQNRSAAFAYGILSVPAQSTFSSGSFCKRFPVNPVPLFHSSNVSVIVNEIPPAIPTPLDDYVLVEVSQAVNQSKSGIILAKGVEENKTFGKVLAVGPGRYSPVGPFLPTKIKPGCMVFWDITANRSKKEVELDGKKYLLFKHDELRAIS